MKTTQSMSPINPQKLFKHYRWYRVVRFIVLNPVIRTIALVVGSLVLIVTWPFIVMYAVYRAFRFGRHMIQRKQESQ